MKKILCVDDDPGVLSLLLRILASEGYEVLTTSESLEAFRILEREEPDLLILDVQMPGMTGLEIFDELKLQARDIPVLFATGYPSAFYLDNQQKIDRYEKGFADGRTDVLYKPFDTSVICEKVASLIGLSSSPTS